MAFPLDTQLDILRDITTANPDGTGSLRVTPTSGGGLPPGASTEAKQDAGNASLASIDSKTVKSDTDHVLVTSSVLPTGAATAAKQDTGNASLSSLVTNSDVAMSTRASESTLATFKSANHTDLGAISTAQASTNTKLDSVIINTGASATQVTAASILGQLDNKTSTLATQVTSAAILSQLDSKTSTLATQTTAAAVLAKLDVATSTRASEATLSALSAKVIKADTDNVTVVASSLPSGAATSAKQGTGNTSLSSIDTKLAGVASAANQTTGNGSLSSIDTKLTSQATAANQSTGNASLSSIDTKLSSQATTANQTTGNLSLSTIASNTTGVATAANQTTGNSSLSTVASNTTGVALATNQTAQSTLLGAVTETAPASDTASSGLNGRLQRIAQRLTTLITSGLAITGVVSTKTPLTANSPFAVSVGVTSTTFLASNASRKGLSVTNTSAATISFAIGVAAVLNSGNTLYPGGTWNMREYDLATGQINAIASIAASNVAGQEYQ